MGFWDTLGRVGKGVATGGWSELARLGEDSDSQKLQRNQMMGQGDAANAFAGQSQANFGQLGNEAAAQRQYLGQLAMGQNSVSAEQLRQGQQRNQAAQLSYAAGASPAYAAGAARTAAIQSARIGAGLAGQQAMAGLAERNQAQQGLAQMLMQQRQQELQATQGARGQAIGAYGGYTPEGSFIDKYGNAIATGVGAAAKSDRRAKTDIEDGDGAAAKALKGLRSYTFAYKSEHDGKGRQFGTMTDDLKRSGLGHAVIDTPDGEMVHGAKLATSAVGLIGALGRRVAKLEGTRK